MSMYLQTKTEMRRPVVDQGIKISPSAAFRRLTLRSGQCGDASAVHLVRVWVGGREDDRTLVLGGMR